jgi:SAM-dependent methyltransferase
LSNRKVREPSSRASTVNLSLLFASEDKHFWFRARNRIIAAIVNQIVRFFPMDCRVLEVGCGTGNVLRVLVQICKQGTVVGMDLSAEALRYARRRTSALLVRADARALPFGTNFHLICLFDVLEHLPDDMQWLRDVRAMLTHGGMLLLTVPAHPWLWSYFDEASSHCRRYDVTELERKLTYAGYRIEYLTQYMTSILPLLSLRRLGVMARQGRRQHNAHELAHRELRTVPIVNHLLTFLLTQEARLMVRRKRILIGASLFAIARKDD